MGFAPIIGIAAFGWLTLFQVMLAAGLPLGRLAWGGAHRVLPARLRVSSAVCAVLTLFGALTVAQAGGFTSVFPGGWITPALWALCGVFALSFLANLLGAKGVERLHGVPVTLLCLYATLSLVLA